MCCVHKMTTDTDKFLIEQTAELRPILMDLKSRMTSLIEVLGIRMLAQISFGVTSCLIVLMNP